MISDIKHLGTNILFGNVCVCIICMYMPREIMLLYESLVTLMTHERPLPSVCPRIKHKKNEAVLICI